MSPTLASHGTSTYDLIGPVGEAAQWAAIFLIAGFVTFLTGAILWKLKEYEADLPAAFAAFHRDVKRMNWIHSWMVVGTVSGVLGMTALWVTEAYSGEILWVSLGLMLWAIGAVFWIVALVWRMTILQDAAARTVEAGALPVGAAAQSSWAGWMFWLHLMLQYLATIFMGFSVGISESFPEWTGWLGAGLGAFLLLGNAARISVFSPPILVHVWPLVLGITILIQL